MLNGQISLELAQKLIAAVVKVAKTQQVAVTAMVVDCGGHPVTLARMDGMAYPFTEVSRRKALTGCSFNTPTHLLVQYFAHQPELSQGVQATPEILILAGGFPIIVNGECVGGLGIAGGRGTQDQDIGAHALAALQAELSNNESK
ncbi:GlcG/HbpS family heme-binding protein [Dictyobacter aurantiacus]|uniref:CDP-alcohol phosphatidyltransferase n=1 Tax=Dictyobacter aurantiacus TaxID=1936993 RepID=A0A401Z9S1_9CHLR|nr:heme-binding protein [Dictyobacter aurantiacus]GCE03546.1 CDP-alcohol phosphatidyltransferase [Dictyobacter aurantiacus]